ncbi:MAG: glycosyltransferase family 87 protein [Sphingomicrobium sp.]
MRAYADRLRLRENALVYALWLFGPIGGLLFLSNSLGDRLVDRDFTVFPIAGKLAAGGHAADAYTVAGNAPVVREMGRTLESLFLYPPHTLFMAVPLSVPPYVVAFWGLQAVTAAMFVFAARPYLPPRFPALLAILTPAALINIDFGQVGLLYGALWLWAFNRSPVAAALLTFKPHLGLLVAVEAVRRRQFLVTTAVLGAVLALSVLLFGIAPWRVWIETALPFQVHDLVPRDYSEWVYKMPTPYLGYGVIGWIVFAVAAAVLLFRRFDAFTAATATFLITPYGFHYDMTVACLGFGLLLFARWREMPAWQTLIAALGFLSPLLVALGPLWVPPILLAGLYVQTCNPSWEPARGRPAKC